MIFRFALENKAVTNYNNLKETQKIKYTVTNIKLLSLGAKENRTSPCLLCVKQGKKPLVSRAKGNEFTRSDYLLFEPVVTELREKPAGLTALFLPELPAAGFSKLSGAVSLTRSERWWGCPCSWELFGQQCQDQSHSWRS